MRRHRPRRVQLAAAGQLPGGPPPSPTRAPSRASSRLSDGGVHSLQHGNRTVPHKRPSRWDSTKARLPVTWRPLTGDCSLTFRQAGHRRQKNGASRLRTPNRGLLVCWGLADGGIELLWPTAGRPHCGDTLTAGPFEAHLPDQVAPVWPPPGATGAGGDGRRWGGGSGPSCVRCQVEAADDVGRWQAWRQSDLSSCRIAGHGVRCAPWPCLHCGRL